MRKLIILLAVAFTFTANAQEKGDWYVGTGDIANVAWTDWAISPSVGYGFTDNLMVGMSLSQADSTVDMSFDIDARYFYKGYFAYAAVEDFDIDLLKVGVGKMFTITKGVFVDPKVVYDTSNKTTNLTLGFGLKF
tara:strand:+ start:9284 stop:9688 length:405 start_codon:yes stop_codon:yes gene_type:complete